MTIKTAIASLFLCGFSVNAQAKPHRLGLGISVPLGLSIVYDTTSFFSASWSIGGEFAGIYDHDYMYGAARVLYWQHGERLSGFYGGPKAGVALGRKFGAAIGGEGGWQYRFHNDVDIGAAIEAWASHSSYAGVRLNVGYLF